MIAASPPLSTPLVEPGPRHYHRGMQPCQLTASAAAALIRERKLSCEELTRSCLARIAARDATVRAWLHLDPDQAIRKARELDKLVSKGALHGLPLGVKDVIDTNDMPTTQNSPIYPGAMIGRDAACVAVVRLRCRWARTPRSKGGRSTSAYRHGAP